jgi:hypothetical protein
MKLYSALTLCLLAQGIFAQTQTPSIVRFEPKTGTTGTTVLIVGRNLGATNKVRFGGVMATSFTVMSDSSVKAVVGAGASGRVVVIGPGTEVSSLDSFIYVQQQAAPLITRFEPTTGTVGTRVVIYGRNLRGTTYVMFGGVSAARFEVVNDTTVVAIVGAGATGQVGVKTPGGQSLKGDFIFIKPILANCDSIKNFQPVINEVRTDLSCFRDSILKLRVTNAGEMASYRWSTGDTTPFIYIRNTQQVTVTVGNAALGCFSKPATVKFVLNKRPMSEIVYRDSALRARPPAPNYRWYFNGQLVGTDSILRTNRIGVYRVETSDDKLCWTSSKEFPFTIGTRVSPADSLFMKVYPNPSSGPFTVAIVLPTVRTVRITLTITDATGAVVYKSPVLTMTGRELQVPLQLLRKGIYRVEAKVNDRVITRTLFIQ